MASKTALHKLDVLHNSAIRFATNAPFNTHHCELFKLVDWPSLQTRRLRHWLQFIYKTLLGKTPSYLSSLLHLSRSTSAQDHLSLSNSSTHSPGLPSAETPFILQQLLTGTKSKTASNLQLSYHSLPSSRNLTIVLVDPPCSC